MSEQEFANAEEAWRAIADADRAGIFGVSTNNPDAVPIRAKGVRAVQWFNAAVAYAQVRGFGHAPRVTLEQMLTNDANKSPDPLDTSSQLRYTNQESDDDARGR